MSDRTEERARSEELAREQSLSELEQAIGDREQLVGDRVQAQIDNEQRHQDEQRQASASTGGGPEARLDDRQARIDREQLSRDVHQETLDRAQDGRDTQQEALDHTRLLLSLPTQEQPATADAATIRRGAVERAMAARVRAESSLVRARAAITRADAFVARAEGVERLGPDSPAVPHAKR